MIDQDSAHGLSHQAKEVLAALPMKWLAIAHLQMSLIDERRGSQSVIRPLSPHVRLCNVM